MNEYSPWGGYYPLWVNGGSVADQAACNTQTTTNTGQIILCYYPSENEAIQTVFVAVADWNATIFYKKIIAAY